MDHAKKMALVPHELITRLRKEDDDALLGHINSLDDDMKQIISSNKPTDVKLKLYQQALQRYLVLKEQQKQPIQIEIKPPTVEAPDAPVPVQHMPLPASVHNAVSDYIPARYQRQAKLLLQHIESHPGEIGWNEHQELLINGQRVVNSNIVDLVYDFVLPTRTETQPAYGAIEFADILRQTNAPTGAILNKHRLYLIRPPAEEANAITPTSSRSTRKRGKSHKGTGAVINDKKIMRRRWIQGWQKL